MHWKQNTGGPRADQHALEIRQAMDVALEDHRAPDFPEFIKPLLTDLKSVFRLQSGRVRVPAPGRPVGKRRSATACHRATWR